MTDLAIYNESEEEMINEIIISKGENLPMVLGDVIRKFEFTDWKAKAWKAMADKLSKLEEQSEMHNAALRSGQQWGIAALYAKKRMGEITREMPKATGNQYGSALPESPAKQETLRSQGISTQAVSEAERIANNPEILDEVIEDAKKRNEIPTQSKVLNRIKFNEAEIRAAKGKAEAVEKQVKETPNGVKKHTKHK